MVALDIFVISIHATAFESIELSLLSLTLSYAGIGAVMILGGYGLRQTRHLSWGWPFYIIGSLNIIGACMASLVIGGWTAITLLLLLAFLTLSYSWMERSLIKEKVGIPILTYLGAGAAFIGHIYLLGVCLGFESWYTWPVYTAGLCALFLAISWSLRREPLKTIYGNPMRYAGFGLIVLPLAGSIYAFVTTYTAAMVALTFAIASIAIGVDARMHRSLRLGYLCAATSLMVIWATLLAFEVLEPQAYIIPFGVTLLVVGRIERTRSRNRVFMVTTIMGLLLLTGSAFYQSLPGGAYVYAILLGFESLLAIAWGIRSHCRCYVQIGSIAFLANAIVQLGPGFIYLPRWIQIGLTGVILLGGGMAALFKREEILNTRQRLSNEWRQWNP
jgi:hypothetical protein